MRILEPGGRLLVIDLLAHNEEWVRDRLQDRQQGFTERNLSKLLENADLEGIHVQRVARDPHPPHFMTLLATGNRPAVRTRRRKKNVQGKTSNKG